MGTICSSEGITLPIPGNEVHEFEVDFDVFEIHAPHELPNKVSGAGGNDDARVGDKTGSINSVDHIDNVGRIGSSIATGHRV